MRTGWLIVRDEALRKQIINWKFYTSICPPAPSEFLAQAAWKVTDLKMQGPNGLDVLLYVRENKLPTEVILITAYANIEDARGAELVGAYDFIHKPFKLVEIQKLIKKAARKARRRAG